MLKTVLFDVTALSEIADAKNSIIGVLEVILCVAGVKI